MRRFLAMPAVAGAAVLVVSCAGVPPARPVLTVEMYDIRAAASVAPSPVTLAEPAVPLADDLVPGLDLKEPEPSTVARPALAGEELVAPQAPGPRAAAQPAPDAAVLVSLTGGPVPSATARFALAIPEAPALGAAARSAPAPAPAAQPAATARGGAASTASSSAAGSAAAAGGSAAGSSAGSAASSQAPSAAPGATYGKMREAWARVGDEVQVSLDGAGFLFLGLPDAQAQANGMSFTKKETRGGKTWFTFKALALGRYDLDFVKQDNTAGTSTKETVRVHVVTDKEFAAALAGQTSQGDGAVTAGGATAAADTAYAETLASAGSYQDAIVELLKVYADGNPALNDRIAGLYVKLGSFEAAGKYYEKNLAAAAPWGTAAVMGLVRVAAATKDQAGLMAQMKRFMALTADPSAEEPLVLAMRMERDKGLTGMALTLATEYAARWPSGRWRDEADFTAAQMLEADSPLRDIARARDLYRAIVAQYPVGDFAEAARDRLLYIERHFYQIR